MVMVGILSIATSSVQSLRTKYGLGRHVSTVPLSSVEPGLKAFYAAIILYNMSQALLKISICLQYKRLFPTPKMKKVCLGALIVCIIYFIWTVCASTFTCIPVSAFWDKKVIGKCLGNLQFWYASSILNIVTDVGIFLVPLPAVIRLQMPMRQKLSLVGIFAIGFLVCLISILRIRTLKVAADTKDPTWDNEAAATWSILELNIGIICGCLVCLKPLVAKFIPQFSSTLKSRSGWSHGYPAGSVAHMEASKQTSIARSGSADDLWKGSENELESIDTRKDKEDASISKV
ncbi:hypothetical protein BGZ60DRAFT_553806 [Tricladium varicosporioides]|nr:hypothetical protein BGZ60DRAFT_553806 [Hymenoscyphus varicosporioides]